VNTTRHTIWVDAPPSRVYAALLDPQLIARWRVPDGMRCEIHEFEARVGGVFRVSLTYDAPDGVGKSSTHTDTYHGHFEQLVPHQRLVERLEFETADPQMQGEMRITTELVAEGGGTRLTAVHENLPVGISPADNEAGWQDSLTKLAALLGSAP
jgi:uncharacterized protein YndB with AHSA1/START domain